MMSSCTVVPPLAWGSSDHSGVQLSLKWRSQNPARTSIRDSYSLVDFDSANAAFSAVDWDDILSHCDDINVLWQTWKNKFMTIMHH